MSAGTLKSLIGKHPLLIVALAALGGILLGDGQSDLAWPMGISGLAFLCIAFVSGRSLPLLAGTFCCFTTLHGLRWSECFEHPLLQMHSPSEPLMATATGRFVSAPVLEELSERREIIFEAEEVRFAAKTRGIKGPTRLKLSGRPLQGNFTAKGGKYVVAGKLFAPSKPLNPTIYDRRTAALRQGIVGNMSVTEYHESGPPEFSLSLWLLGIAERGREWIGKALSVGIEDDQDAVKLIRTMALGTAEKDTEQMAEPFRNSGTLHVFAVSGLHVGLIGVIGMITLRLFQLRKSHALMILIPLVFGYAFITGWRASAARAAFMMALMVFAPLLDRHGRICNALGLAALLLWATDTQQTFEAGFQLSFLVLMSIAIGSHLIAKPFLPWARIDDYLPLPVATWWQRTQAALREGFVMLLATSAAAWAGSTPLMIGHFRTLSSVALAANVLLVPLSFFSLACVALSLMAALLGFTSIQTKLNNANLAFAHVMTWSAEGFSAIPGGNTSLTRVAPAKDDPPELYIPSLASGQSGQLLVAEGVGWWLDCGGKRSYDSALRSIITASGVREFRGMIFSHSDSEHLGAAHRLFKRYPMSMVKLPVFEPWPNDTATSVLEELTLEPYWKSLTIQSLQAGERVPLASSVVMEVLHPSGGDLHDTADDRVLVCKFHIGTTTLLWVSDAGFMVEKALLERFGPSQLHADILLRGQHATDISATLEFLHAVQPRMIITPNYPSVEGGAMPVYFTEYCQRNRVHLIDLQEDGMTKLIFERRGVVATTNKSERELLLRP